LYVIYDTLKKHSCAASDWDSWSRRRRQKDARFNSWFSILYF